MIITALELKKLTQQIHGTGMDENVKAALKEDVKKPPPLYNTD
jgi:hypothetical protein